MIIYSEEIKPGMKLKQPIIYRNHILLDKDNILTEEIIEKIKNYKINYIDVHEDNTLKEEEMKKIFEEEKLLKEVFTENYNVSIENAKNIINNIKSGNIDKVKIDSIVGETIENLEIDKSILISLLNSKTEDDYLFVHSINTLVLALTIGMALEYTPEKLRLLGKAAFLHDIGMVKIPKNIIFKDGNLTESELAEIKKHTYIGVELIGNAEKEVIEAIKYHHERTDGSGYPEGLKGKEIPEMARIIAIADVYSALTEDRKYRNKYNYHDAMKIMMQSSIKALDTNILKKFLTVVPIYPINSVVYLNDGKVGKVVKSNKNPFRPVVDIEENGKKIRIDLSLRENSTKYIVREVK